eukprot:XP_001703881.1 Hypothetical protein GL50803_97627 [Giardia lamblia ATCC 50803]
MAPAESPLLLAPEDTHLPPSSLYPSLHWPHLFSSLHLTHPSILQAMHWEPSRLGLWSLLVQPSHLSPAPQCEHPLTVHAKHPLPARLGLLLPLHAVHVAGAMPGASSCVGAVHAEQPSTPTYALAVSPVPVSVPRGLLQANTD